MRLILDSGYFVADGSKDLIGMRLRELAVQPNIRKILELPCRGYETLSFKDIDGRQIINARDENAPLICAAIGLAGWAAWTAADRIRDGENIACGASCDGNGEDLYIFSILRPIMDELVGKLSLPTVYIKRIKHVIGMMEYANSRHCALGARKQSSWKSMGAAIPLMALMMKVGASNKDIEACESFFYHFIMARQLSDDALDWKEDSGATNDTLVVKWLGRAFEERIKYEVAKEMLKRSKRAAKKARSISCFTDTGFMEELPGYYEKMAERVLMITER